MNSFMAAAQKKVTDIRAYLRDQQTGNSIRYRAEKGNTHLIYIPFEEVEVADDEGNVTKVNQLKCIAGNVHEWTTPDGKYHSTICLKDAIRKDETTGEILNDGTCPFCDRIGDAWNIYNMRKANEEEICQLPAGAQRDEHLKSAARTFADERKAKEATSYVYLLVAQFVTDKDRKPVMENGLPTYNLRVMKLSTKRLEKIVTQVSNAGEDLPGSELLFSYPDTDDLRLAVGQSTITLVFPNKRLTALYPSLLEKIDADVKKFSFEGLDKQGFTEWAGMTTAAAQKITDAQFEQWDKYQKELKVNPNAQYLEYITIAPSANPSLNGAPATPTVAVPGLPVPSIATPDAATTNPEVANADAAPAAPAVPELSGNIADLFGSAGGGIQL